ncbi:MAG: hypothetical protein LBC12_00315 [Nitrososphaerota archaeon]|nr:hypothetical protein [Nitrososphaerota archaeon]
MTRKYTKARCPKCGTTTIYARPQTRKENCHPCFMQSNGNNRITITPLN